MKLARRRTVDAVPQTHRPPVAKPPRGAAVAVFAGLLDGRRMWLAVETRPDSRPDSRPFLALRAVRGSDLLPLSDDLSDDLADDLADGARSHPAYLSARLDLDALPGHDDASYEVVVAPADGGPTVPVWTPPLPDRPVPPAADGRTQYALRRSAEGQLQVARTRLADAVTLSVVHVQPEGIGLRFVGPARRAGLVLALLGDGDTVLASYPTTADDDGTLVAVVTPGATDDVPAQLARVVVGDPGAWLPVRRRANALADAGAAAALPQLYAGEAGSGRGPRLRLRWSTDGLLQARLFGPDRPAAPAAPHAARSAKR